MVLAELIAFDSAVSELVAAAQNWLLTEFFTAVTALGSVTVAAIILIGLWMYDRRETAVLTGLSVFLAGGTTSVLKEFFARARPETAADYVLYHVDSYAFPSGHATIAFALATVLVGRTQRTVARLYLYGLAVLVAVSRVYLGFHYTTDVVAGGAVGGAVGLLVLRFQDRLLSRLEKVL